MARYIDADELLETLNGLYNQHLTMRNYAADGATADCIEAVIVAPTADVAPKSEVERLRDDNKFLQDRRFKELSDVRAQTRTEVAREIFEEFEKYMMDFVDVTHTAYKEIGTATFAELKKKYTGG